jgi:hypothetical protein
MRFRVDRTYRVVLIHAMFPVEIEVVLARETRVFRVEIFGLEIYW